MTLNIAHDLDVRSDQSVDRFFEPTINIFNNGIVINYKKVGTRFLQRLTSSDGNNVAHTNQQIDFSIFTTSCGTSFNNQLQYKFGNPRYVFSEWHWKLLDVRTDRYSKWANDEEFFKDQQVNSYTEFFFQNKKDITFIVRNPISRFFSGLTQILMSYIEALPSSPGEQFLLKKECNFSDKDIDTVINSFIEAQHNPPILKDLLQDDEIFLKLFNYMIDYKWDLIAQDAHAEPYLLHFREMLYNIEDLSKVKIINLNQLSTRNSYNYFCELRGDTEIKDTYENITFHKSSNIEIYHLLLENYISGKLTRISFDREFSIIDNYLRYENLIYNDLINSPNFINLED